MTYPIPVAHVGAGATVGASGYRNDSPINYDDPLFAPAALSSPVIWVPDESMDQGKDYVDYYGNGSTHLIVQLPTTRAFTRPLAIGNCARVRIIGGHLTINEKMTTATTSINRHRALGFNQISEHIYIEGLLIDNSGGGVSEGLQTYASPAMCVVKNTRIDGVMTRPGDGDSDSTPFSYNHPDLIDHMSGGMRLMNVSLHNSDYQGDYANSEAGYPITERRHRNVDAAGIRRKNYWLNSSGGSTTVWLEATNTYFYANQTNTWPWFKSDNDVSNASFTLNSMTYNFQPAPNVTSGTLNNGFVRYTNRTPPLANGLTFLLGRPSDGDYAPADKVGTQYDEAWFRASYAQR